MIFVIISYFIGAYMENTERKTAKLQKVVENEISY